MKFIIKHIDSNYLGGFIKKINSNYLGGLLSKIYVRFIELYFSLFKITPIPSKFYKDYSLKVRLDFFKTAQYYLQTNRIDGVYAEFGSHEVNTFRMALRTLGLPLRPNKISKFYAFDSFEGMPDPKGIDKQKIWKKEMNFTSKEKFEKIVKKDLHRVVTVKGFYENSLPNFEWPKNELIALAYIDCDYYQSTKECLNFIKDKLQHGSLVVFDDWDCYYSDPKRGQKLAFSEFKENLINKYTFIKLCHIATGGCCFIFLENDKIGKEII